VVRRQPALQESAIAKTFLRLGETTAALTQIKVPRVGFVLPYLLLELGSIFGVAILPC
jgi:hypothetical protein